MSTRARSSLLHVPLVAALAAALATATPAAAAPSAANSTLPNCVLGSPDGTFVTQVLVRDGSNVPIAFSSVVLNFTGCPAYLTCNPPCYGCTGDLSAHTVRALTNTLGIASFDLRVGGVCPNQTVAISADNVPLGTRKFSSLDQTGDLFVSSADVSRVQSLVGTTDTSANFDCSGTVNSQDVALVQQHVGSTCTGVVAIPQRSWGSIKTFYR